MVDKDVPSKAEVLPEQEIFRLVQQIPSFEGVREQDVIGFGDATLVHAPQGAVPIAQDASSCGFWVLLQGRLTVTRTEKDGGVNLLFHVEAGDTLGEAALMIGLTVEPVQVEAAVDSTLLRLNADGFWHLLASCLPFRRHVIANMASRLVMYETMTIHRQKAISLSTLSAGLMHEFNNPGSAALRASAQLRDHLTRLKQISERFTNEPVTTDRLICLQHLQLQTKAIQKASTLTTLQRTDTEEDLANWLDERGVESAWSLAPVLVTFGWGSKDLEQVLRTFELNVVSDALHYVANLMSSFLTIGSIEESLRRIMDLVKAVKEYAYDNRNQESFILVDVNASLKEALAILHPALQRKDLTIEKHFETAIPKIYTHATGIAQAWSNIIQNAIDASPQGGTIKLRTWMEGQQACIAITDHGQGIRPEDHAHIFEPFFTTKPVGAGTGMGLHIAHRILVANCAGQISFSSYPGNTEFIIRLPTYATPCPA